MRPAAHLAALLSLALVASLEPSRGFARARQERLPDSTRLVLDNGFTAIFIPNRSTRLVTSVVVVGAGSSRETAASNGISHMLEHLLFDGTARRSQEQIASEMDRHGIINNAHTGTDHTAYFVMAARERFGRALDIQSDMLFGSIFPEEKLASEREIVANEIAKDQTSDETAISGLFASRLYRGTGLELPVTGTPDTVRSMTREAVVAYHRQWYVPNNMTAVIMGDFDAAEMEPLVRRRFGAAAPGRLPEAARASLNPRALGLTHARRDGGPGRLVWLGAPAPAIGAAGFDAASLLASLLGDDLTRAVNARLAAGGKGGTVIQAAVSLDAHAAASAFLVRAALDDAVTFENASRALSEELSARLSSTPWKTSDLDRIRLSERAALMRLWEKPHYFGLDRAADIAAAGWDFARDRVKRLSWVEMADVNDMAKNLAAPAGWAVFVTGRDAPDDQGAASLAGSAVEDAVVRPARPTSESRDLVARWKGVQGSAGPDAPEGDEAGLPARTGAGAQAGLAAARSSNVRAVMPNGLQIAMDYSEDSRVFAAHVLIGNRSAAEPAGKGGIAELLHRVAGSGTRGHPGAALDAALESIGGTLKVGDDPAIPYDDIYLSPEYSYIRLEALDEFAPRALDLLGEILSEPLLDDPAQLERARDAAVARARQAGESPKERCRLLLARTLWGASHPFAAPLFGTEESLRSITAEDLRSHHTFYFNPRNIIVGIGTSIRPDAMLPMLEAKLGRWSPGAGGEPGRTATARGPRPAGPPIPSASAGTTGGPPRFQSERHESAQAYLMWGRLIDMGASNTVAKDLAAKDAGALDGAARDVDVMRAVAAVLSRRMVDALREKKGLTYSTGAEATPLGGWLQVTASMGFLPGRETAAREALREVLASLSASPPSAREVEEAMGSSEVRGLMRSLSRINRAWSRCLAGLRPGTPVPHDAHDADGRAADAGAARLEQVADAARSLGGPGDASSGWYEVMVSPSATAPAEEAPPETGSITGEGLREHLLGLGSQDAAAYVERFFRRHGLRPGSDSAPFIEGFRHVFAAGRVTGTGSAMVRVGRPAGESDYPARAFPFAPPVPADASQAEPLEEAGATIFLDPEDLAAMAEVQTPPRFEGGTVVTVERRSSPQTPEPGAMLAGQMLGCARMGASSLVIVRSFEGPSSYEDLFSDPVDAAGRLPFAGPPPELLVLSAGPELGEDLMGRNLFLKHAQTPITASDPAFRPMPLDLDLTASAEVQAERVTMVNIVAVAPGRDAGPSGEAVLVTADYSGMQGGDRSGVAALLETARLLGGGPAPRTSRSLVFAATDGGETGLAGSRALAGRLSEMAIRPSSVVSIGSLGGHLLVTTPGPPRLREMALEMAAKAGVTPEDGSQAGDSERADPRFPFHLAGIPSIRVDSPGRPGEEMDPSAMEKAARLVALIVWALAR